ncbi:MAG: choloylglycine hydrolase [Oscillospiraceae bacterium]|nr:choloylglycine hydrolase [Oscillospiraceae bacterium]
MCTAITYKTKDFYFGRTLDYEFSYGEQITVTPRNFPLAFRGKGMLTHHHAIIGMAHVAQNYPLYYDAVNEKGLSIAGLNFVGNAEYRHRTDGKDNIAAFEFIPWILAQCATVAEAKQLLQQINLTGYAFSDQLPPAQLHWMIADRDEAITVESTADGLHIHPNPVGVLTNNPPFEQQLLQLRNYMQLSASEPENRFCKQLDLQPYSRGMGAMGLPGDLSSQSRFIRAAFTKLNSVCDGSELGSVSQFFHILDAAAQTRGCCRLDDGKYEITIYSSCCNADKGIYYYTTYDNRQISAVDMHQENLNRANLILFPLITEQKIFVQNMPHLDFTPDK